MAKYLDNNGLLYFWQKIKNTFALASHNHAIGDVTDLQSTLNGKAPTSHASSATTYGKGTSSNYGHVKLSDSTSATTAASSGGTAATPKAVSDALAAAKSYADSNDSDTTYTLTKDTLDGHKLTLTPSSGTAQTVTTEDTTYTLGKSDSATDGYSISLTGTNGTQQSVSLTTAGWAAFEGATSSANGKKGLVPQPASGQNMALLWGDGTWQEPFINTSASAGSLKLSMYGASMLPATDPTTGTISASKLVTAIGTNPVNRATADASGNNIADTYAKKTDIAGTYKYKGSVADDAHLPTTGQTTGDVYNIESAGAYGGAGANVAWNGSAWDSLGEIFTINSITNSEIDTIVAS